MLSWRMRMVDETSSREGSAAATVASASYDCGSADMSSGVSPTPSLPILPSSPMAPPPHRGTSRPENSCQDTMYSSKAFTCIRHATSSRHASMRAPTTVSHQYDARMPKKWTIASPHTMTLRRFLRLRMTPCAACSRSVEAYVRSAEILEAAPALRQDDGLVDIQELRQRRHSHTQCSMLLACVSQVYAAFARLGCRLCHTLPHRALRLDPNEPRGAHARVAM
jgi:hypothetical protein